MALRGTRRSFGIIGDVRGAWPGVQPFGGWKGSGSGGKAGGGLYHVQQYLREQSRTVVS
jgi:1-pyrroline-5-carboxylate dehydrogenase